MVHFHGSEPDSDAKIKALEHLIIENEDFQELKKRIGGFNIFEAMGAVRQELRHSNFIAFLLDPNRSHGLGDICLKKFLQRVLQSEQSQILSCFKLTALELELHSLEDADVRREWKNIDILIDLPSLKRTIVIENKTDTDDHHGQLSRYRNIAALEFCRDLKEGMLCLYLTPNGRSPIQESDSRYLEIGYDLVRDVLSDILNTKDIPLTDPVRQAIEQYTTLIENWIMEDSKVAELCRRIYRQHQLALDLILQHKPNYQEGLAAFLKELIQEKSDLITLEPADQSKDRIQDKRFIRFSANELQGTFFNDYIKGSEWNTEKLRLPWKIMFEFWNFPQNLELALVVGFAPDNTEQLRLQNDLCSYSGKSPEIYRVRGSCKGKWRIIHNAKYLQTDDYLNSWEEIQDTIRAKWDDFFNESSLNSHTFVNIVRSLKAFTDSRDKV